MGNIWRFWTKICKAPQRLFILSRRSMRDYLVIILRALCKIKEEMGEEQKKKKIKMQDPNVMACNRNKFTPTRDTQGSSSHGLAL